MTEGMRLFESTSLARAQGAQKNLVEESVENMTEHQHPYGGSVGVVRLDASTLAVQMYDPSGAVEYARLFRVVQN
jgi:hypothetical protein